MESTQGRPVAFVQVDLDGLWAVRRCYGSRGAPEQDDPVYSHALPALLGLFDQLDIKATFFVVGADLAVTWKQRRLEVAVERGHELANHSMTHDMGLGRMGTQEMEDEIAACQTLLKERLGVEARGFRAPGYGLSADLIEALGRLDLWYDASLLPTPWGVVMRRVDRWIVAAARRRGSNGRAPGRPQYGTAQGWHAPLRPYRPDCRHPAKPSGAEGALWEIPVSVSPRLRLPFHGGVGFLLGRRWVDRAVRSLSSVGGFLNYVIHGIDLVEGLQWDVTSTRRGKRLFAGGSRERFDFFANTCREIAGRFEIVRTDRWVEEARCALSGEGDSADDM